MVIEGPAEVLQGRREEREALERLLGAVRGGQSRVLVVSPEESTLPPRCADCGQCPFYAGAR
jgi:hypothetical protein